MAVESGQASNSSTDPDVASGVLDHTPNAVGTQAVCNGTEGHKDRNEALVLRALRDLLLNPFPEPQWRKVTQS